MDLLLDTHIWLWSVGDQKRLTSRVARELATPSNQLWLSPISIWELQLLHGRKRVDLGEMALEEWIHKTTEKLQFNEATVTIEVAMELSRVSLPHDDPADRFLVASAKVYGLTLVTADECIINSAGISILANRPTAVQ
ncbi:MAG TPA: type II toxin-antitoxin system VapC family toxin [Terriglobales bacterium]|nr:type II toxin-antitoxin system VapC family toxin [Terriglobales bacterium]